MNVPWLTILFIAYLFVLLMIAIVARHRTSQTFDSYALADRKIPCWLVGFTLLGSYIGGGTLVAMAGKISLVGLSYFIIPVSVGLGFWLLGRWAKFYRTKLASETTTTSSFAERLSEQYDKASKHTVRSVAALLIFIIMLLFMSVQLRAGGEVIQSIFGLPALTAVIGFTLIVALYTFIGGTRADVWTDFLQICIVFLGLALALGAIVMQESPTGILENLQTTNEPDYLDWFSQGLFFIIGVLILTTFAIHTDAGIQQRLLITPKHEDARKGSRLASLIYLVFGALLICTVLAASALPDIEKGDQVLFSMAKSYLPVALSALFMIAIVSAIISTVDSEVILLGVLFTNDYYKLRHPGKAFKVNGEPNGSQRELYKVTRWLIVFCFILVLGISIIPFKALFDLISSIWVLAIGCFGLPLLGLIVPWIGKRFRPKLVVAQMLWSAVAVAAIGILAYFRGADVTNSMVSLGLGLVIFNFIAIFVHDKICTRIEISKARTHRERPSNG